MVKKQRGKATAPIKKADNEKPTKQFDLSLESSDDEAPEEVKFEDSKAQALQSMKQALDTARREKELLKENRRKRQELFKEQKKRKLLPAEVLEEIDPSPSKKLDQSEKADEEEEEEEEEEGGAEALVERTKLQHIRNLKGNYKVMTVTEGEEVSFQRRAAEDFIQSRLYGPGSCRSTNNEVLSLQNKTGKNKSAAVNFVKKDWASKNKAKAERLKKRWIHKQQIPPC